MLSSISALQENPRVLLIDDHPSVRRGIFGLLAEMGWTLAGECGTLAQARTRVKLPDWAVVILDITLPDGNGLDFLHELRQTGEKRPVLVHSVLPDAAMASRVLKAGGNGFVNKGCDPVEFKSAATKVLSGGRYVSPVFAEEIAAALAGEREVFPHEALSTREYQVMLLIAEGKQPQEIAKAIGCTVNSISTYRARILKKLDLSSSLDIMRYALTHRLISF